MYKKTHRPCAFHACAVSQFASGHGKLTSSQDAHEGNNVRTGVCTVAQSGQYSQKKRGKHDCMYTGISPYSSSSVFSLFDACSSSVVGLGAGAGAGAGVGVGVVAMLKSKGL